MPAVEPEPAAIHERTHELRLAWEHAEPNAAVRLDQHAAAVARSYLLRPDKKMAIAFADAAQSVSMAALSSGMAGAAIAWAQRGLQAAEGWARADLGAVCRMRLADAAIWTGRPGRSESLLRDASSENPWVRTSVHVRLAEAMAAGGNGYSAFSELDKAEVDHILAKEHPRPSWAGTWGENWLASWRGTCAVRLGKPHLAVRPFQQVMARTPATMVLAKAEAKLGLAHAALAENDVEGACLLLGRAVVDLRRGGDAQHMTQALALRGRLVREHGNTRYVRELDEVIRTVV